MKKIGLAFLMSLAIACGACGQDYNKIKVGLAVGYAFFGSVGDSHGAIITLEPAYLLKDNLAVGLRIEGVGRGSYTPFGSYTVNGQYYLNTNKFRPFAGAGIGLWGGTLFGFYPRAGFDVGHFSLSMDYNIVPGATPPPLPGGSMNTTEVLRYLGIRIGCFLGGGRKR